MKLLKDIHIVERLNQLIRLKATGTPEELSQKLDLSERQTRRIIEELKEEGLPIQYCKHRRSYIYKESVFMKFEIFVVKGDDKKKIIGGEQKNFDFFKDFFPDGHFVSV